MRPRASIRRRASWAIRLVAIEFRRHRRATLIGVCAFAVATLALVTGVACLAGWRGGSLGDDAGAADQWEASPPGAELVAFLREDLPASSRDALAALLGGLPGVAGVRLLESDKALSWMRAELGDRSSVLDGVEEGFLPATLEVSLRPGPQGVGRADAIAWRLRRMEGITEVDVLRTTSAERSASRAASVTRAARSGIDVRGLGKIGAALGSATALLAVGLAAVAMRRRRTDAHLLAGFGFTAGAIATPAAITGAACALAGTMLGALLVGGAAVLGIGSWRGEAIAGHFGGNPWWASAGARLAGVVVMLVALGAGLGWWGARPGLHEAEDLAPTD